MSGMQEKLAIELLKFIAKKLDEGMEYAKHHTSDTKAVNIAGFCANLKQEISRKKAELLGQL